MDAPRTVGPVINLVFTQGGTMAAVAIAENGFVLCPYARPRRTGAAMAYQASNQRVVFAKVPNHKTFNARVQAHINQDAIVRIVAFLFTISKALFGLLPGTVNVDMWYGSVGGYCKKQQQCKEF